jgi:hypothetical protein
LYKFVLWRQSLHSSPLICYPSLEFTGIHIRMCRCHRHRYLFLSLSTTPTLK